MPQGYVIRGSWDAPAAKTWCCREFLRAIQYFGEHRQVLPAVAFMGAISRGGLDVNLPVE